MTRLGVVTGLRAEAKLIEKACARARRAAPALASAGANGARARDHAARLIGAGAELVLSFGLCGGLDPALGPGDLVLADEILGPHGERAATDAASRARLRERLESAGLRPLGGAILGSDRPVATAAEKAALFARTQARAVDMESHGVAAAAAAAGIPVLALRAVADPAGRDLPKAALKAPGPDGRLRLLAVIATMYLRPWEGPAMIRLAYEARLGFDALERVATELCLLAREE